MDAPPMTTPQRCRLLLGLLTLGSLWQAPALQAEELYQLNTTCSTPTARFSCQVTAVNVNDTTEYRHKFGTRTVA